MILKKKTNLDSKDIAILSALEHHEPQWVILNPLTFGPMHPLEYYQHGRHFGDNLTTAIQELKSGSGLGILPDGFIYAVRFHAHGKANAVKIIQSVLARKGFSPDLPPPLTANSSGEFIALFRLPPHKRGVTYRNFVANTLIPGTAMRVSLYLGPMAVAPFLGPVGAGNGFHAVNDRWGLFEIEPEEWVDAEMLTKMSEAFLTAQGTYRQRMTQAKNHLKSVLADIQPLDDASKIVEIVAADLVACFRLIPHDAIKLLRQPLGKGNSGQGFLEGLSFRLPACRAIPEACLRGIFDGAVDAVPPLGVAALKRMEAKAKLASLLKTLALFPPPASQTSISAERFRLAFCELSGVDPQHLNQTVFGTMVRAAIRSGHIRLKKERFIHFTKGDHMIYLGIDETTMKQAFFWQQEQDALSGCKPKQTRGAQHW